jgi:hypothetical protein
MLTGVFGTYAQEYVILEHRRQPGREHTLKLPQYMIFTYESGKKQYRVVEMNTTGIFTDDGPVELNYVSFRARWEKPKSELILGRILGGIGLAGMIAVPMLETDSREELATTGIVFGSSLVAFFLGARIARTRHNYRPNKWQVKETPVEMVKVPLMSELNNPRYSPPE